MPNDRHNFEKLLQSAYDLRRRQETLDIVQSKVRKKIKIPPEARALGLDVVFFLVPFMFPLPTVWRWIVWVICFGVFVFLVPSLFTEVRRTIRLGVAGLSVLIFCALFVNTARSQWIEEEASKDEGDLAVDDPTASFAPMVQLAGSTTVYPVNTPIKFFPDAPLSFGLGKDGSTTVTTKVEDREGHRLVEVKNNHWQVFKDAGDKNYRKDALEVLDRGGHVVLQLRLLKDYLVIWGEWHDEFGDGVQLTQCLDPNYGELPCFQIFGPALPEKSAKRPLGKIFEYPSRTQWGKLIPVK